MRYLLFGASTTAGEIDYENGGWAGLLKKYLDKKEKHCYFHNLAISGNTTKDILRRIEFESKERIRDKTKNDWTTFLCLGTNDSRLENNTPVITEEEYKNNVTEILKIAKNLTGQVVVVGSQPIIEKICNPFKGFILFLNERILKFETITKECTKKESIQFIEIFSELEKRDDLESLYADGLHPNTKGHKVIFEIIKKELE